MKKITAAVLFIFLLTAQTVWSHSLWINLYESFAHPPGHALTSIGWGHNVPMDDFLNSKAGAVKIDKYLLVDPENKAFELGLPDIKQEKITKTDTGMTLQEGDLGIRRIGLSKDAKKGTYQVLTESKTTYFSGYIDVNGKMKMVTKPMDEIKDASKFQFATRYKAFAKSYMTVGEWTQPKKSGFDLEILPLSDLSKVKKGDIVQFEVTLNDEKLNCDMKGMNYLFATSNTFGGPDNYNLCSYIMNGKAQIRVPEAGQWVFSVLVRKNVTKDNELKDLYGKCDSIYYGSTVSINVKP